MKVCWREKKIKKVDRFAKLSDIYNKGKKNIIHLMLNVYNKNINKGETNEYFYE